MMHILHICQRDDPNEGGSLRVAQGLVRAQKNAGLQVSMLFLYGEASEISAEFSPNTVCLKLGSSREAAKGFLTLSSAIRSIRPDVIHSHEGIIWPRLVYLGLRIPVVTHAHLPAGNPDRLKNLLGWPLTKRTTDQLIGISQPVVESWIAAGFPENKIHLVPNGVDFGRFSPVEDGEKTALREKLGLPLDRKIIVWVGRLHRESKGTDRVEFLGGKLPDDVSLVVVGDGVDYKGMVERSQPMIEDGRMIFAGSSKAPEEYYRASDSYLFSSYREAFGLVILEAVACGLPMLAFPLVDGGGATMLLKEFNAVELPDRASHEVVGRAINTLFERKDQAAGLREHALKHYSWKSVAGKVSAVYETAIEQYRKS